MTKDNKRQRRPDKLLPSLLTPTLKGLLKVGLVLAAFMLANTVYLLCNRFADGLGWTFFAVGEISLPQLFQAMVLTHTGIGLILVPIMLFFAIAHLPKVWRRRHRTSIVSGVVFVTLGVTILVTGLFILTAAASRDNRWAWWAHVVCAALIPAGYIVHRLASYTRPASANFKKYALAVAAIVVVLIAGHSFTKRDVARTAEAQLAHEQGTYTGPGARARDVRQFADGAFVPAGYVPPGSPFFPSAATTTTGDYLPSRIITRGDLGSQQKLQEELKTNGFVKETEIGAETCARCHQDIVRQWAASAHRFASFNNPFYEATIEDMRKNANAPNPWVEEHVKHFPQTESRIGMVKSKWCSGCHDPSLMLAGKMDREIDRTWPEAQAGLTCLACHAIDKVHDQTGNGNYNIADEQEDPYLFANAKSGTIGAFLHDAALRAKPTVHKRQMLKPFFRTSEYCATCHKVSLREPLNNYRWLRGQDEYDNWHDSGVALNAARTFYLPPLKRQCQDCHMPLESAPLGDLAAKSGFVKSHRFLAVNTALPFLRGDQETIERIEEFLQTEKMRVDVFALKTGSMERPVMAIDKHRPVVQPGETVTVDVVVRNLGVGHTFPGGTNDSNEGWLEFTLSDAAGNKLAISGYIDEDGHLDPMAHVFKALILDKDGKPIHRRNAQDIHVTVFANVVGPGTADIAHYEFVVPEELAGKPLTLQARLLWRKFDRRYTEFAFFANREGFKQFDDVPDLPVTEIASDHVIVGVAPWNNAGEANGQAPRAPEWIRYNDYGIGLFMEGDTRGAAMAFEEVMKLQPESIEGPLNLAKTSVQDGNLNKAFEYLGKCEALKTAEPRVAWVWGVALQEDGQYEKAAQAYERVLEQFPDDRATWRNLGRTYYLDQQYEEALQALSEVLRIDPEDRVAHYHRMLCLRALGRDDEAKVVEHAYEFYQIDESAQKITREFRLDNPGANLMAQAIRTHKLEIQN
jgi:tetratricopeptide (TPR) repeat protein